MYTMQYKCATLLIKVYLSHEKVEGETEDAESKKILVIIQITKKNYKNTLIYIIYITLTFKTVYLVYNLFIFYSNH